MCKHVVSMFPCSPPPVTTSILIGDDSWSRTTLDWWVLSLQQPFLWYFCGNCKAPLGLQNLFGAPNLQNKLHYAVVVIRFAASISQQMSAIMGLRQIEGRIARGTKNCSCIKWSQNWPLGNEWCSNVFQFQTSENGIAHCFRLKDRSPKAKATTRPEVKRSNRWTRPYWCSGSRHTSKQLRNRWYRWFYSTVDTESSKNPRAKQNKKSWAVIWFEKMAPLQSHGISSCSISRWFGGPHGQTSHGIVAPKDFCHLRSVHVHSPTPRKHEKDACSI